LKINKWFFYGVLRKVPGLRPATEFEQWLLRQGINNTNYTNGNEVHEFMGKFNKLLK